MKDLILNQTKRGLDYYYLIFQLHGQPVSINGKRSKNLRNPFYKDKNASFSLYFNEKTQRWHFRDYGNSEYKGDVFDFAAHRYKLDITKDFRLITDKMYEELLKYKDTVLLQADTLKFSATKIEENLNKEFQLFNITFSQKALDYFAQYKISKEILEENNVQQISGYQFFDASNNKKVYHRKNDELIFAYKGEGFAKIYHPNPKKFLYVGNKPKDYEFGLQDYDSGEIVILVGGEKDVLTAKSLGYNAFCLSSEMVDIPRDILKDIYYSGAHLIIMYDIDNAGLKESQRLSSKWNYPRIILPNELKEKGGKDISDWVKLGLPVETIHELINETINLKIKKHSTMKSKDILEKEEDKGYEIVEQNVDNANNATESNTNLFPIDVLPLEVQDIVINTNKYLQFPIDFIASALLGAVSAAMGKTHKIEVRQEWYETGLIYIALVGKAGTNKSHPLDFAVKPIKNRDAELYRRFKEEMDEYETLMRMSTKERKEKNIHDIRKPVLFKTLVSDITSESVARVLEQNPKGIALYADELAAWIKNLNRYHKGSDLELWLSNWSNKSINVDRATKNPIFIPESHVSVLGTIQPSVLERISKQELSTNGFIDRILTVIPDTLRKEYFNKENIDPQIAIKWSTILTNLLKLELKFDEEGKEVPEILTLSNDAFPIFTDWNKYNTDLYNNEQDAILSSIFSKLEVYVFRLALIIEMLKWACGHSNKKEIQSESMSGAIKLIEYFRKNAIKANDIIMNYNPLNNLASVLIIK